MAGTGNFGASTTQLSELPAVTLLPGQSFLVQEGVGTGGTSPLPAPDLIDASPIALSASAGKIALVRGVVTLGCNGSSTPCSPAQLDPIVDLVGYGSANFAEATPTAATGNTTSAQRLGGGCVDTNTNAADFSVGSVVTALTGSGFYLQDPSPDTNPATSEGIFVFTGSAPSVSVGDSLLVSGPVTEFRAGCTPSCSPSASAYNNLTITEFNRPTAIIVLSSGNLLPASTRLGAGGRVAPTSVIEDDAFGSVEDVAATFDAELDGIDFYESLEGMRLEIANAQVVGPTRSFGSGATQNQEIAVVADNGASASTLTARGGVVIATSDFNPERVFLSDALPNSVVLPTADVADRFSGVTEGVLDYSFGNFKLLVTSLPSLVSGGLVRETLSLGAPLVQQLSIASFNVENLDPLDPATKFQELAGLIVNNLASPDLLTLEEVQDNNGATNDGTVSADVTLSTLVAAISAAGGPSYGTRSIEPVNSSDGGEPGGNIRVAFLFRTDRGLTFIDRAGGTPTSANDVVGGPGNPELLYSPGRIDPLNPAFSSSRKPLAGEFLFNGKKLFVIANHFNSKGGDQPLFGRFQPPTLKSETQRVSQANIVSSFVQAILSKKATAAVVVAGDLNDYQFSAPVNVLKAAGLSTLVETLPASERYSYVFDGNSQVLDHIMVTPALSGAAFAGFDVVHVNAEFAQQTSDHDPAVARFTLGSAPTERVRPVLECVVQQSGFYTAYFGYLNPNLLPVSVPVGAQNKFTPAPLDRGQTAQFLPGRQVKVFAVSRTRSVGDPSNTGWRDRIGGRGISPHLRRPRGSNSLKQPTTVGNY